MYIHHYSAYLLLVHIYSESLSPINDEVCPDSWSSGHTHSFVCLRTRRQVTLLEHSLATCIYLCSCRVCESARVGSSEGRHAEASG